MRVRPHRGLLMHEIVDPMTQIPEGPPVRSIRGKDFPERLKVRLLQQWVFQEDLIIIEIDKAVLQGCDMHEDRTDDGCDSRWNENPLSGRPT